MGLFSRKSEEEKVAERYDRLLDEYNVYEGVACRVVLPERELVVESHGALTRGLATGAFGLVGLAASGGVSQVEEQRSVVSVFRVADNGLVFEQANVDGSDLRIPWNNITNSYYFKNCWSNTGKKQLDNKSKEDWTCYDSFIMNIIGNQDLMIIIYIKGMCWDSKKREVYSFLCDIINSNACGVTPQDEGW